MVKPSSFSFVGYLVGTGKHPNLGWRMSTLVPCCLMGIRLKKGPVARRLAGIKEFLTVNRLSFFLLSVAVELLGYL